MEDIFVVRQQGGLTDDELRAALEQSLQGRNLRRVLIIPPDFTRFHSQAGKITNLYYHLLKARGVLVDILPALGTHAPVTKELANIFAWEKIKKTDICLPPEAVGRAQTN